MRVSEASDARRIKSLARWRALSDLASRYPDEFVALKREHTVELQLELDMFGRIETRQSGGGGGGGDLD